MEEVKVEEKVQEITPSQYFDILKGAKQNITTEALKESYDVFVKLGEKYKKLGQKESMKRLCFLADTLIKEEKLIELGVTTYIYKDKIEDFIENVADKAVKIVELSRYMREIPDELVDTIDKTRDIFDEFYVVFTDYTGKEERKVAKERKDKDPILFGVFSNESNVGDRFYFLGDWVDEYCDLTLDKMIEEYNAKKQVNPTVTIEIPNTTDELISLLNTYKIDEKITNSFSLSVNNMDVSVPTYKATDSEKKTGFFGKIRNVLKK